MARGTTSSAGVRMLALWLQTIKRSSYLSDVEDLDSMISGHIECIDFRGYHRYFRVMVQVFRCLCKNKRVWLVVAEDCDTGGHLALTARWQQQETVARTGSRSRSRWQEQVANAGVDIENWQKQVAQAGTGAGSRNTSRSIFKSS